MDAIHVTQVRNQGVWVCVGGVMLMGRDLSRGRYDGHSYTTTTTQVAATRAAGSVHCSVHTVTGGVGLDKRNVKKKRIIQSLDLEFGFQI